jgi:7-cyano-7-deazaguanine reductase
MEQIIENTNVAKHLGQKSSYVDHYDPSLLVRAPRQNNRTKYGVQNDKLPFVGFDVWNNYEVSCLLYNGMPVTTVAKIVYSCDSEYIVESKSHKLYWNGFNVTKLGKTVEDCYRNMELTASKDLSQLLETDVKVSVFHLDYSPINPLYVKYNNIDNIAEYIQDSEFVEYKINPEFLKGDLKSNKRMSTFHTSLLRSRCEITSAPDTGDIFIYYKGLYEIDQEGLLKYIVSHRETNEFHEPTAEHIYMNLWNKFKPEELSVFCLYTRRGSLDINPFRASHSYLLPNEIINPSKRWTKTIRQ